MVWVVLFTTNTKTHKWSCSWGTFSGSACHCSACKYLERASAFSRRIVPICFLKDIVFSELWGKNTVLVINGVGVVLLGESGRELWYEGKWNILRQFRGKCNQESGPGGSPVDRNVAWCEVAHAEWGAPEGQLLETSSLLGTVLCCSRVQLCNPMCCSPPGSSVHGDSPGKNTGVGCHALLQGIFPTQGSNPGLPHCWWILYPLSHQGRPRFTGAGFCLLQLCHDEGLGSVVGLGSNPYCPPLRILFG